MADTDPNDKTFGFREGPRWFDAVKSFFGNAFGRVVIPAGVPLNPLQKVEGPDAALVAKAKAQYDPRGQTRMHKAALKLSMWENDYWSQVEHRLRLAFHPLNYARMKLSIHLSSNLLEKVIKDLSVLYEQPAKRKLIKTEKAQATEGQEKAPEESEASLEGQTEQSAAPELDTGDPDVDALADELELSGAIEDDPEDVPFKNLMAAFDWDTLLDGVEKLARFLPCVWVRPMVIYEKQDATGKGDPSTARLNYIVYTPDCADVIPHPQDPTRAAAWFYWADEVAENGEQRRVIHFFTPNTYYKFDSDWRPLGALPNPMGRLPVTVFRIDLPLRKYYLDGVGDDLYEGTLEQSVLKTIQNARARDAGFKQLAIQGDEANVPADQVMGGPTPIYTGEEATATVLDFTPHLDEWTNLCKERELSMAVKYGINANEYKAESTPQSGFAKKLDREKVLKESRRVRKHFAASEQDLYQLTAATLEHYPITAIGTLDKAAKLQTDFSEPVFEEDPQNQARVDALDLKMNAISVVDILRRKNPDLSDVELIKLAYRNKRINSVFMTSDQMRLLDVLANRAIVGGSIDKASGGAPGEEGEEPEPKAGEKKPPSFGKGGTE